MTNLRYYAEMFARITPEFPEDIPVLRDADSDLCGLPDRLVELLWEAFSDEEHCAGHLEPMPAYLEDFKTWLHMPFRALKSRMEWSPERP